MSCEIALMWMPQGIPECMSTMIQVNTIVPTLTHVLFRHMALLGHIEFILGHIEFILKFVQTVC